MIFTLFILGAIPVWVIVILLLVSILGSYLLGALVGTYQKKHHPDAKAEGVGPLEGSLLGLLALLLSFTFSMSASRYDERRLLIIEEANDLHIAVLRADMYPDSIRTEFRNEFQQYVEARIAYHNASSDENKIKASLIEASKISARVWGIAARFSVGTSTTIPHSLMLPAINDMIDVVIRRESTRLAIVPESIIWLLIILTLLGSSIIGYSKLEKKHDWIVLTVYAIMTVLTIYTIIDLDRPRRGLIRADKEYVRIEELRELFTHK